MVATTEGGGSYVYVVLLVAGLAWGRGWRDLARAERVLLVGFALALLAMALSLVNTVDTGSGLTRLERYARIATIGPILLVFRRVGFPLHWPLGLGAVLATLVMAAQAWYQVGPLGQEDATGAYHAIVFGDLAVLWGCLGVVFALTLLRGWASPATALVTTAAATYASVRSEARGSWLFAPVFLVVLGGMLRSSGAAGRGIRAGAAAVILSGVAVGVWQWEPIAERLRVATSDMKTFAEDPAAETSLGIRLNLWRNSLLLARESPVLGTGLGDFQEQMRAMVRDGRSWSPWVADYTHAHSIYLDALANAGLLGLVATFLAYLWLPLRAFGGMVSPRQTQPGRFCAIGGIVIVLAFATFGLSEALWTRNPFVNTYVVCVAVFLAGLSLERPDPAR